MSPDARAARQEWVPWGRPSHCPGRRELEGYPGFSLDPNLHPPTSAPNSQTEQEPGTREPGKCSLQGLYFTPEQSRGRAGRVSDSKQANVQDTKHRAVSPPPCKVDSDARGDADKPPVGWERVLGRGLCQGFPPLTARGWHSCLCHYQGPARLVALSKTKVQVRNGCSCHPGASESDTPGELPGMPVPKGLQGMRKWTGSPGPQVWLSCAPVLLPGTPG